jgi:hypothetical protein
MKAIVAAFLLCSLFAYAQDDPAHLLTNGGLNGRAWKNLSQSERVIFVAGFVTGTDHAVSLARGMEIAEKRKDELYSRFIWDSVVRSMSNAERSDALDRFYDAPENAPIEISNALDVVAAKASGESETKIKRMVSELLRKISKNP